MKDINEIKIKEALRNKGIEYEESTDEFIIGCPNGAHINAISIELTFHINKQTSAGQCFRCGIKYNFSEWSEKLGIKIKDEDEAEDKEEDKKEVRKKAEQLVEFVSKSGADLFHDQLKEPHVRLPEGAILKLNSKLFRRWLAHKAWKELGQTLSGETLKTSIRILEGKACFESPMFDLQVRVAKYDNALWYDLGKNRVAKITADGWEVTQNVPILFRHFNHQKPKVEPVGGGSIHELVEFLNIRNDDPKQFSGDLLLALVSLVAGFIPDFPHPILVLHGPQGAAKTTLSRMFKELIDPSAIKTLTMPTDIREFVQLVSHHWYVPFDNLSYLKGNFSDALCRAVTGDGFSKRELFSDDDDVIYEFQRLFSLNGINLAVERADLLDRCLIIGMERVSKFEEAALFWKRFHEAKPRILGAIFDLLVVAFREADKLPPTQTNRMADFVKWGRAITKALGYDPALFVEAYRDNDRKQHEEALEASPVALTILDFMANRDDWEGTPSELLSELLLRVEDLKIDTKAKSWPKDPRWLWKRIQEARTNLEANGIQVTRRREGNQRTITIKKVQNDVTDVIPASNMPSIAVDNDVTNDDSVVG